MQEITAELVNEISISLKDSQIIKKETNELTQSEVILAKTETDFILHISFNNKSVEQFFQSSDEELMLTKFQNYALTMQEKGNPFSDNGMSKAELKELAAQLAKPEGNNGIEVATMMSNTNITMTRKTFEHLHLADNEMVLELGHGNAHHLKELLSFADNLYYKGLDISKLMKEESEIYSQSQGLTYQAEFITYDGVLIPLETESIDKIFTVNTIYFWTEPETLLSELLRVLKPNGTLFITFVKAETMDNMPFTEYGFQKYSEESFLDFVQKSNVSHVKTHHYSDFVKTKLFGEIERKFIVATLSKN